MQRLTLILSDLYLPEEGVGGEARETIELPELSELLRIAEGPEHIGDWRRWLLRRVGGQLVELPLAAICAFERPMGADLESAWLATPVALEARLDHVRMVDRGLLHLEVEERTAWCQEFNRVFGPQYSLHDCGPRAFVLSGLQGSTKVIDPARLLGAEIGPALPGAEAPELRRLWAEIEMWLHGSALNDARERARKRRVSALWLWGRDADPRGSRGADDRDVELWGEDPLIGGLSRMRQPQLRGVPKALAHIESARRHAIVEFAALTGHPQEALAELDKHWLAAARRALTNGKLLQLEIVANDRCFRITPHARWRFWRQRRGWLENLAH
jgi:hypothetical protein